MQPRQCETCGTEFTPYRTNGRPQRYCSHWCQVRTPCRVCGTPVAKGQNDICRPCMGARAKAHTAKIHYERLQVMREVASGDIHQRPPLHAPDPPLLPAHHAYLEAFDRWLRDGTDANLQRRLDALRQLGKETGRESR